MNTETHGLNMHF